MIRIPECPEPLDDHPHPQVETEHGFTVDEAALPILRLLWRENIHTICSCQGDVSAVCGCDGCDGCDEPHEIFGSVSIVHLDEALSAFRLLTVEIGIIGTLERVGPDECHDTSDEYTIWMPPMATLPVNERGVVTLPK